MTATTIPARQSRAGFLGFTIVELLVVLAVILVLVAALVPMTATLGDANLRQGASLVESTLALARQTAIRENQPVEVRFLAFEDPGEAAPEREFRGVQTYRHPAGIPISGVERLPDGIVVMDHPDYSTLVTATELARSGTVEVAGATGRASYFSFHFLPDGSTNLRDDTAGAWFLTVVEESGLLGSGGELPDNFVTVQVEPFTGSVRRLQP